ncbi:MLP-like protein 43 [Momordica charantia]|uniref:MLP-like protein 43 n=1 Tax=Momordica charantia TaxID=3673 RepID=A0A6J1DLR2_MOMCH|nr:MLP-like protein 43 [Momordica charantia]
MSLKGKLEADVEISASASKFHEMFHKKPHHISNASVDKIQDCQLHDGDWGKVGSIICWNYFHAGKPEVAKQVIEAVDEEKNLITFKMIEGDIMDHYKNFKFTMQATPKGKGSVVHWTLEYEKLHENIPDSYSLLELVMGMSRDIDAHLIKGN